MNFPPACRANSQLNSAVRTFPMCSCPVGDGAKRTRTWLFAAILLMVTKSPPGPRIRTPPAERGNACCSPFISPQVSRADYHPEHQMPSTAIGPLIFFLAILLTSAHLLGHLFARLRQPRVIGEILAGIVLGPFVLGKLPVYSSLLQLDQAAAAKKAALDLLYQLGLLLLMFLSGAETRALFQKHERRQIAWLATVGTVLPFFIMLGLASLIPL